MLEVAVHVFRDDDGVVGHDTGDEDQREECDSVQRVACEIVGEERQRKRDGHRKEDDQAAAPAHSQHDEERDDDDGQGKVQQKLRNFVRGGLSVVAGDLHLHVVGDEVALQMLHFMGDELRQFHGVGALLLGDGDGDGQMFARIGLLLLGMAGPVAE